MKNILNCKICHKNYDINELILINGDVAECPNGHSINLINLQTYDYVQYINIINAISMEK